NIDNSFAFDEFANAINAEEKQLIINSLDNDDDDGDDELSI
ncbi:4257_t:CDS:1, partial [Entrophospora sp. SA101]